MKSFRKILRLSAILGAISTAPLSAQQLANAPSTVMLAGNLQQDQQPAATGTVTFKEGVIPVPADKELRKSSEQPIDATVPERLTIADAERLAVQNNPRIRVSQLLARAQHQVYRETRSAYLPVFDLGSVAARADSGSRFTIDGLRSARLLSHVGGGVNFHQLLFDFGHTSNLIAAAKLREKAQKETAIASRLDIILVTDQAFYNALEARDLVKLAEQTVKTRNATNQQITELTKNKLRSDVDLAFSEQNVAQAQLLLLDAQTQYADAINALTSVMGFDHPVKYEPVDSGGAVLLPPPDADALVQIALKQRPDLLSLNDQYIADKKYTRAQWEQQLPSLNTMGVVGLTPIRDDRYFNSNWFGSIGANFEIPIFNGFLFSAEADEARNREKATREQMRDLRDRIVRDVRDGWMQTNTSYQKIGVTQKFLDAANLGLKLADARYRLGLSSIVELSQAELTQTQAAIENVNARFQYEMAIASLNYQLGTER